jgi:predicted lipoprotein with Yx(FWY)xxD motif
MKIFFLVCSFVFSLNAGASLESLDNPIYPLKTSVVKSQVVLTVLSGLSIYVFDPDIVSRGSNCNGKCAEVWPPVLLGDDEIERLQAPLGVIERKSGTKQLTYNGRPVYTYFRDRREGDGFGDGIGGVWHLVPLMR